MTGRNPAGKMNDWSDFKEKMLADADTRAAYEESASYYQLVDALIRMRKSKHLTQRELADILNVPQSNVARLESGRVKPTWPTLARVLDACEASLAIRFTDENDEEQTIRIELGAGASR